MARPDILFGDPTRPVGGHVLAHQCIAPDTLVQLSDGNILEAKDVHNPLEFSGLSFETLKQDQGKCNGVFRTKKDVVLEINNSLRVSPEHTVFKINGLDILEVETKYLKKGDYLLVPKRINISGSEVELPSINIEKVFVISPKGSRIIKQRAKKKGISLKRNHTELFGINARHLRRVLNQRFPTKEEVIRRIEDSLDLDLGKFVKEFETNKHKKIRIPTKLNPAIAQIFGYFVGDGNLFENSLRFRDSRREVLDEYNKIFSREFLMHGSITKIKNKKCFQLMVSNKYVSELFRNLKNDYMFISKSTEDCIKGFLKGIFDAEGSITNNKLSLTNKNKKLLEFAKFLLLRFGIHSHINKMGNIFRLYVIKDVEKFFENIGLTAEDKTKKLFKIDSKRDIIPIDRCLLNKIFGVYGVETRNDLRFVTREYLEKVCKDNQKIRKIFAKLLDSNLAFEKITNIKVLKNKDELIDVSIPTTENFIANGYIVHNSTYRVYLRKGAKGTCVARLTDASNLPPGEAIFKITEDGIRDV